MESSKTLTKFATREMLEGCRYLQDIASIQMSA